MTLARFDYREPQTLEEAVSLLGGDEHLHHWRMGDDPPRALVELGPFDAITALGSTWPQILDDEDARHAARSFQELLRPGGLVVIGSPKATLVAEKARLQAETKRAVARAEKEGEAKVKAMREEMEKKQKQLQVTPA